MNRNTVETIKQKLSIESVVGSYIKLEKSGKNFRACCPFHNEKTPSFQVTPDLGIYYCFGCQKGGDIFNFVQEIEGLEFIEALKQLAEKAGVSLEAYTASSDKPNKIALLREIMEQATRFYEIGLRTDKTVVEYLLGRSMTKETMVAFRIGYAQSGWSHLYDYLKRKKYSDEDILATGLCIESKSPSTGRKMYDRFRERIMFPITDNQGRVIAFTGRVMPGTEEATRPVGKYINSPETDLYHKSHVLFGFDKAKSAIHTQGFVIVVEGQMDCIMSHQSGITHVVALSGTASTDAQMKQLKRFTDNIAICLDADSAGLAAAQKTAIVAYQNDMKVLIIDISSGKDPADAVAENPELWKQMVRERKDVITFRLEKMKERNELDEKTSIAEKELFPLLSFIRSQITVDDKLQEIAHAFGSSSVEPIRKEFEKFLKHQAPILAEASSGPHHGHSSVEVSLEKQIQILEHLFAGTLDMTQPDTVASISDWDRQLGSFQDNKSSYELLHKNLMTRYEMHMIDEEREKLNRQLIENPDDVMLLQKIHEISRRKDSLVHQLTHR